MRRENIEDMIGASEAIIVEWKPSLSQINEIINTIAAFANTEGGTIIARLAINAPMGRKKKGCKYSFQDLGHLWAVSLNDVLK